MNSRLELQKRLEELLGNRNVYYQPPENLKMEYPAIVYSKSKIESKNADNSAYMTMKKYEITVIDKKPDNPVIDRLPGCFLMCGYDRHYKADNLNHDVFTLYF